MAALSHLFMITADLASARAFWVDGIGLEVLAEHPGYVRVGGGGGFHLGIEERPAVQPSPTVEIAVRVDDVDLSYVHLAERGIVFEGPPADQPWGARHAWLRDPDGNRLSIFS